MKKKFIAITFLLLITFGMIGCGKNQVLKKENVNETNQEQATETGGSGVVGGLLRHL